LSVGPYLQTFTNVTS